MRGCEWVSRQSRQEAGSGATGRQGRRGSSRRVTGWQGRRGSSSSRSSRGRTFHLLPLLLAARWCSSLNRRRRVELRQRSA